MSSPYMLLELLGCGAFGEVFCCVKEGTRNHVAIKEIKPCSYFRKSAEREIDMMEQISVLDPDKCNIVRFIEHCNTKERIYLVYEMLDVTLFSFIRDRRLTLSLPEIRAVIKQVLVALTAINSIGIVHGDIKSDNIMLVNHEKEPFRVKLIDFGYAGRVSQMKTGCIIQAIAFRAPEVSLGFPLSEVVDMWSLGCVMVYLYQGANLYPGCEYTKMTLMVKIQGQPEDHMLDAGKHTHLYFTKDQDHAWMLKDLSTFTYPRFKNHTPTSSNYKCLDDIRRFYPTAKKDTEDMQTFLSLLKQMLHLNPNKRITASEALEHNFILMEHQSDSDTDPRSSDGTEFTITTPYRTLTSKSCQYTLQQTLGVSEGVIGKVFCYAIKGAKENVAVKMLKKWGRFRRSAEREIRMMKRISVLDPDECNIVRFIEYFSIRERICLVYEILDMSLFSFINDRHLSLSLTEIQVVIKQVLVALTAMRSKGMVHQDIRPHNIMLVDHEKEPFRVKLIDFGNACHYSKMQTGNLIQAVAYRAPEVSLGLPLTKAVDMWSLGCVMAFLYLGANLYPGCEYDMMTMIVEMQGQPGDQMLNDGKYTQLFFSKNTDHVWRLNTKEEYIKATGLSVEKSMVASNKLKCLDDIKGFRPVAEEDTEDMQAFLSLLKQMLHLNPKKRITVSEALQHDFISMHHESDEDTNPSSVDGSSDNGPSAAVTNNDQTVTSPATGADSGEKKKKGNFLSSLRKILREKMH
ncbi:uncharacterized protein LOC143001982 [Genypterus blacodes]|uniref:uncharacterized protein LOC143001982 n=1 Tax=Genypterus blacodes TaxID=154954 RepID=UPI003F7668A4